MDSIRFDRHDFFSELARAEERASAAIGRMLSPHYGGHTGYGAALLPDWVLQNGERVARVERALHAAPPLALAMLGQKLAHADLRQIWPLLREILNDLALYLGGPIVLGGAIGAGIGLFAGGVGAIPGAAAGAALGAETGSLLLSFLGLKSLLTYMAASVPRAADAYLRGFKMAWGAVAEDGHLQGDGTRILHRADFAYRATPENAADEFARGHVIIVLALLAAIVAYLSSGRGDLPALLTEIRASPRLGPKMADWVAHNAEALKNQPVLQSAGRHGGPGNMVEAAGGKAAAGFWQKKLALQAKSQVDAAAGIPIEWHFSTQSGMDAAQKLLDARGVTEITTVLTPKF